MNREEFLYQLESLLMDLPKSERDDALDYYEQYFEAAGPEREAEVIRELGSPQKVSEMIHSGGARENSGWAQENRMAGQWAPPCPERPKKSRLPLWIALGVCGVFLGLGVLFLLVGAVNFHTVDRTDVVVTEREEISEGIEGFVRDVIGEAAGQTLDRISELEQSGVFDEIQSEIADSFRQGSLDFRQMREAYQENPEQIQGKGKSMLQETETLVWKDVKEIHLQIPETAVLICRAAGDTVQAKASREGMAKAGYDGGELTIESVSDGENNDRIILFLPENRKLEKLEIEAEDGYVEMENLEAGEVQAEVSDGMLKNSGTVNAESFSVQIGDGYMEGGTITALKSLEISIEDGMLSGGRLEAPELQLECGDGVLKAEIAGQESEYRWKARVGDGLLKVNEEHIRGTFEKTGGEKSLTVTVKDGIGTVTFAK